MIWALTRDSGSFSGGHDPLYQREEEIFRKLAFVDVKNFTPLIRAEVLMSAGLLDCVSPPSAQSAGPAQ